MKKSVIYTLLFCVFTSCSKKEAGRITFQITGKFLHTDNIQLFYNNNYFDSYSETNSIIKNVSGSSKIQNVTFELPMDYSPSRVRIDLGDNKAQSEIIIYKISICYDGKCRVFGKSNLLEYFEFNKSLKYFEKSGKILLSNRKDEIYDPYFISKNISYVIKQLKN